MADSTTPALSYSPETAAAATGVSRTRIFNALRDNELTAKKHGRRTIIPAQELTRWIESMPARKTA